MADTAPVAASAAAAAAGGGPEFTDEDDIFEDDDVVSSGGKAKNEEKEEAAFEPGVDGDEDSFDDEDDDVPVDDSEEDAFEPEEQLAAKKKLGKAKAPANKKTAAKKTKKKAAKGGGSQTGSSATSSQASTASSCSATPQTKRKAADSKGAPPEAKKAKSKAKAKAKSGKKAKPVLKGKADEIIYDYMYKVNRPYNATGIFENLHRAIPRKQVDVNLEKLVKEGKLGCKAYGKTKIFWLHQGVFETLSLEEMAALEDKTKGLQEEVDALKRANGQLKNTVLQAETSMSDAELDTALASVTEEVATLKVKLQEYSSVPPPDPQLLKKQAAEIQKYLKMWKLRKRALMDFVGQMSEGMGKSEKAILKDMECETDEQAGCTPKTFR